VTTVNCAKDGIKVLNDIPVHLDVSIVMQGIKFNVANKRIETELRELIEIVLPVVHPKVLYKVAEVTEVDGKRLGVNGFDFTHHVPSLNFSHGERVFPYVATCGLEIETIKFPADLMKGYCLNLLKNVILMQTTVKYFEEYLKQTYMLQEVSRIGPGEAMGDTSQQKNLFSLLGDVEGNIGVKLSGHNMMLPEKSSSGIYFETTVRIESCQLCPNQCNNRRGSYNPDLFRTFRKQGVTAQPKPN
jgi:hypothetical protein